MARTPSHNPYEEIRRRIRLEISREQAEKEQAKHSKVIAEAAAAAREFMRRR